MTQPELLAHVVWATSAVAGVTWLAALALRRSAAGLRNWAWRVPLLSFLVTPAAVTAARVSQVHFPPLPPAGVARTSSLGSAPALPDATRAGPSRAAWEAHSQPLPRPQERRAGGVLRRWLLPLAVSVWALGIAAGGARFWGSHRRVRSLARAGRPMQGADLHAEVSRWCAQLGVTRRPALWRSPEASVPMVVGWHTPTLLLPADFSFDVGSRAVVVHELAHIGRGDLAAQWLARATRVLWWWHPLAWHAAGRLQATAEEACDDWAVALTGEPRALLVLPVVGQHKKWSTSASRCSSGGCSHTT